jgi:hypothetical protein
MFPRYNGHLVKLISAAALPQIQAGSGKLRGWMEDWTNKFLKKEKLLFR